MMLSTAMRHILIACASALIIGTAHAESCAINHCVVIQPPQAASALLENHWCLKALVQSVLRIQVVLLNKPTCFQPWPPFLQTGEQQAALKEKAQATLLELPIEAENDWNAFLHYMCQNFSCKE